MEKGEIMTDRHLMKLWRKAVLLKNNNQCIFCGNSNIDELECHHFIRRRVSVLRWDWKNGFPLCNSLTEKKCHIIADTMMGRQKLINIMGEDRFEYLALSEKITKKDYCLAHGLSQKEFEKMFYDELKKIIENNKNNC
jgi:hypothetical protein